MLVLSASVANPLSLNTTLETDEFLANSKTFSATSIVILSSKQMINAPYPIE